MGGTRSRRRGGGPRHLGGVRAAAAKTVAQIEKRRLVRQPHRQVVHDVGAHVPPGAPLHVRGPAGHPGEMRLQIGNPGVIGHPQTLQGRQHRVVGPIRRTPQPCPRRPGEAAVRGGQPPPGGEEAPLPTGHRPGGIAEVGRTPFRGLGVDRVGDSLVGDLGASDAAAHRRRCFNPEEQVCPQDFQRAQLAPAQLQTRLSREVGIAQPQRPVEIAVADPAFAVQAPEHLLPQRRRHAVEISGPPDRLLEGQALQPGEGVHRDEGLQRIVRGHHPGRDGDVGAESGPPGLGDCGGVRCGGHHILLLIDSGRFGISATTGCGAGPAGIRRRRRAATGRVPLCGHLAPRCSRR